MRFIVARAARITGQMLEEKVREMLHAANIPEPNCVVCYGAGYEGREPSLNAHCNADKFQQGVKLREVLGREALELRPIQAVLRAATLQETPWIARKTHHTKGKDIRVCKTLSGLRVAQAKGRTYVTSMVDSVTEYRAFVYRKRVLAVYEKRLTEPEKNVKFGRNRENGWTFHALPAEQITDNLRRVAVAAVRALDLDFGAVDILGLRGGGVCVLEVNSAPGVSDEHRTSFVKLATRIVKWAANGCPGREA
jgi:hypothetical protein